MLTFTRYYLEIITVFIFILMIPMATAFGQTGKISGTITDAETGEPLPGVNVILEGTDQGAATDANGTYFIINISPGTYSVTASMIGYQQITKTDVQVSINHTTPLDFELQSSVIEGESVTVEAEREIIKMDQSSSSITTTPEEIEETPGVSTIGDVINLQAGVEGFNIRGGSVDQTGFMMDGMVMVDNATNQPMANLVNLSQVQSMEVIKGGFNAEYGNIRSGLIHIDTKDGGLEGYSGAIELRSTPSHLKHNGLSLYDHNNYFLRPYLDPDVMWVGTKNGEWDETTQNSYDNFIGWDAVANNRNNDSDPSNDMTAEEARDLFLWRHMAEGSNELAPDGYSGPARENQYGHKPDWLIDAGIGGPVPFIPNLSFFFSARSNNQMFGLPTIREYYREENFSGKLTYRVTENFKVHLNKVYGEINTVSDNVRSPSIDGYERSATSIFYGDLTGGNAPRIYFPSARMPYDIFRNVEGIEVNHSLSPATFYTASLNYIRINHRSTEGMIHWRDTTHVRNFGTMPIDEQPYGFWWQDGNVSGIDGMTYGGVGSVSRNWTNNSTINFQFDITTQVNRHNQLKTGISLNFDNQEAHYGAQQYYSPAGNSETRWDMNPYRLGAYIQDKLEFQGLIANVGVRADYFNPNTEWYEVGTYSKYFSKRFKGNFTEAAPKKDIESVFNLSPRVGISHPISANSKLYFNYGHFYSLAPSRDLYRIYYGTRKEPIRFVGNPAVDMPRTISYEVGYEHDIANLFLIHLSGYYKNITGQVGQVWYTNFTSSVDYATIQNNNYEDIRGFEIRIERRVGRWFRGWVNYDYRVESSGFVGREHYFEDTRQQQLYGLQNPTDFSPRPRPVARGNVTFSTPPNWGPTFASFQPLSGISVNLLYTWRAGNYFTWDPLETHQLVNNVQWAPYQEWDARIGKRFSFGGANFSLYANINNLFDHKNMAGQLGFADGEDFREYMYSLKLPLYEGEEYGWESGDDRPGDIQSDGKSYINMPNRKFLTFLNPRIVTFGLRVNF